MLSKLRTMVSQRRNRDTLYNSADYWDSKAEGYDGNAVSMWPNNHLNALYHAEQLSLVNELLPSVDGLEILDLGCGTGRISRWLAGRGARVVGLDFSQGALDIAQNLTEGDNPRYVCRSVFDIDEVSVYDVIVCWGCVTVACQDRAQLSEVMGKLHAAIRPGGQLIFLEPIHRGLLHRVLNMSVSEFLDVMRTAGFRIDTTRTLHFWPVRLMLAYIPWPGWITRPVYWTGQFLMRLPGLKKLGDYHGIKGQKDA